jgi:Icc-related predicted phosphoesterase
VRIIATSDCHGKLAQATLPPGDVLVLAGDLLADAPKEHPDPVGFQAERLAELDAFLCELAFKAILLVAGNHDGVLQTRPDLARALRGARYLEDEGCTVGGVRFWGSPWQPGLWHHPFFMADGHEALNVYRRIPADTQVLITHTPPWGILDRWDPPHALGSRMLRACVAGLRPPVHVFGHMHPSYGTHEEHGTRFYNAALCDGEGVPRNPPHIIDI